MKTRNALRGLFLVAIFMIVATSSNAVTIQVAGVDYDFTTVTTSFNNEATLLQSQPWWLDKSFAETAAAAVNVQLGTPTFGNGPMFAYQVLSSARMDVVVWDPTPGEIDEIGASPADTWTFATATIIPEPTRALLLTLSLVFALMQRRRR